MSQTDMTDRQWSDSIGRTVLQTVRPKSLIDGRTDGMKVNMNKTKVMISAESHNGVLEDSHVVYVVEVLVETHYSVLTVRNGCRGSVVT